MYPSKRLADGRRVMEVVHVGGEVRLNVVDDRGHPSTVAGEDPEMLTDFGQKPAVIGGYVEQHYTAIGVAA